MLTDVAAQAQVVTNAALRFDIAMLTQSRARLADMWSDPVFDLGPMNEIYRALRQAIIERQPGRSTNRPAATPVGTSDQAPVPLALVDVEAALSRMVTYGAPESAPAATGIAPDATSAPSAGRGSQ
jgi:hypothetical protein